MTEGATAIIIILAVVCIVLLDLYWGAKDDCELLEAQLEELKSRLHKLEE